MLQPGAAWEDELVLATFSNYIFPNAAFGHTSSPCAVFIRSHCLRPHRSFSSNRIHGESTAWQHSWGETRPLVAWQCSWAGDHPAPPSPMEHPLHQIPWSILSTEPHGPWMLSLYQSWFQVKAMMSCIPCSQPSSPPRTWVVSRGLHIPLTPSRRLHVSRGTFLEQ